MASTTANSQKNTVAHALRDVLLANIPSRPNSIVSMPVTRYAHRVLALPASSNVNAKINTPNTLT
jgi:hypothetical protein